MFIIHVSAFREHIFNEQQISKEVIEMRENHLQNYLSTGDVKCKKYQNAYSCNFGSSKMFVLYFSCIIFNYLVLFVLYCILYILVVGI